jgi:hypothetical protein
VSRRTTVVAAVFVALLALAAVVGGAAAGPAAAQSSQQNERCLACHADDGAGSITVDGAVRPLTVDREAYAASRHGVIDCTGCHIGFKPGEHSAAETEDWLYIARVAACATCHADVSAEYARSIHGDTVMRREGGKAPTCATCHGSHEIAATGTQTFHQKSLDICRACHGGRTETYLDTYHGKSFVLGRPDTATCVDCHGAHLVLPASNPASSVSDENIVATCQTCHPEANERFATYIVHDDPKDPDQSWLVFLTYAFYIILMTVVFTFGGVHTFMYFYRGRKEGMYRRSHD